MQFIAALLSCRFLYCRICVVIIVSSALANYKINKINKDSLRSEPSVN